jgi:hypothetical protein
MISMENLNSTERWSEITIGNREENLNLLYNSVVQGKNLDLLGKTTHLFLKKRSKSPATTALLRLAVQNQDRLNEDEKAEVWSEVLEKFSPGVAFQLAKRYLSKEWKEDFIDSLFSQNGRLSPSMKKNPNQGNNTGGLPEWMLRNPFGIAKKIKESSRETKSVLELLKERLPESYPCHTVLFVDAFLERNVERFIHHYYQSGRMKFHPQSLYMKAMMDIRRGEDEMGEKIIHMIRESIPGWEIPSFLFGGKDASQS